MSTWSWIADAFLALLLTGTLVMTIRLDKALRVVRRDRTAFEALISNLGSATGAVKVGIQALRNEADRAAGQIERRSEDADKMATDLSFLIEAADRAGDRLELRLQSVPSQPPQQPVLSQPAEPNGPMVAVGRLSRRRHAKPAMPLQAGGTKTLPQVPGDLTTSHGDLRESVSRSPVSGQQVDQKDG